MKVFVAGGSGAMGRRLVPQLVAAGYAVTAMTRDQGKASWLRQEGAQPVIADALDRRAVTAALRRSEPEVVIHQLTGLAGVKSPRNFDKEFALTNRLRTEGTDYLLDGARAAGARRIIAQSYGNWNYARTGSPVKTEQDPLDPEPPARQVKSLQAIRYLEDAVVNASGIEGIALRYGNFYGPGTGIDTGGEIVEQVRKRMFPIVGDGAGIWSFVHMDDAAAAAIAAIEHGRPGVYNVADDGPAPARRESYAGPWLPEPLPGDADDVAAEAETTDSLTMAFLVVLETLTPLERAAFLLHDVFGYGYGEISAVVGRSQASCRQLASRARRRVHDGKPRFETSREQRDRLAAQFFAACQGRDMDGLVGLLAADAAFYGDGGTRGTGVNRPVHGRENVAKLLAALFRQGERLHVRAEFITINGQPGAKVLDPQGRLINVLCLDVADGSVRAVRSVVNPDKLTHLGPLSPLGRRSGPGDWT